MKHLVSRKQQNSRNCIVCGLRNDAGLKAAFFEMDNRDLVALFTPLELHQSYPGRLHGGVAGAVLDETIGRAIMIEYGEIWGVTIELQLRYRRPLPLEGQLTVVGRITSDSGRIFEGTGEIYLPDGQIAVTGAGKYMKKPIHEIADFDREHQEWRVVRLETDPETIDYG